jgi:hypothetical protein
MTRGEVDVFLRFDEAITDDERTEFVQRMSARTAPDFELTDADGHSILRFWRADEQGALARAHTLVRALCDRIGVDHVLVGVSLVTWAV